MANQHSNAAGRPSSPFDIAPTIAAPSTAVANRNSIKAALHLLGIGEDDARVVLNAIVAGQLPLVTYGGA